MMTGPSRGLRHNRGRGQLGNGRMRIWQACRLSCPRYWLAYHTPLLLVSAEAGTVQTACSIIISLCAVPYNLHTCQDAMMQADESANS